MRNVRIALKSALSIIKITGTMCNGQCSAESSLGYIIKDGAGCNPTMTSVETGR